MNLWKQFPFATYTIIVILINGAASHFIQPAFVGAPPKGAVTFPHLVTVSLPSQTQFTLRFNVPKHSGPTGSSLHTSTLLQKLSRFIWIKLDYARLTWKQESALTIQSRRNQSDRLVSRQPRHNPPTPRKPAWKRLWGERQAPLPAIYLKRPVVGQRKNREV